MKGDFFQFLNHVLNMNFKNSQEFEKKYLLISLQRGKIFNWAVLFLSFYNFYLDYKLHKDITIDIIYRRNLFSIHLISFLLSIAYLVIYKLIENKNRQFSFAAKALILSEMAMTVLIASALSLNGQRFAGNIDAYIILILAASLLISVYPKWVLLIYGANHILFLIGLSYLCTNNFAIIKQFNSSTTVLGAAILFLIMYQYNIKNFLHEKMLEEDKITFIKLFEMNPFPLLISRFEDGKIQHANHKAMLFYDIPKEISDTLKYEYLYENVQDLSTVYKTLEEIGSLSDYFVGQRTLSGQIKYAVINYEVINYFGTKSILSGITDTSEIKRIERELTVRASTDELTGVLNRGAGIALMAKKHKIAQNNKEEFNLCFFDVDNLKIVNDTFGHLEGDALISLSCKIIKEELHPSDIILRYGGDEFMILFDNRNEREIDEICGRIKQRFESLNKNQYKPYSINVSFGVFSYKPEMNLSLEQIIEIVDKDMYHNKAKKKQDFDNM